MGNNFCSRLVAEGDGGNGRGGLEQVWWQELVFSTVAYNQQFYL